MRNHPNVSVMTSPENESWRTYDWGENSQRSKRADLDDPVEGQGKLFITSLIAPEGLTT